MPMFDREAFDAYAARKGLLEQRAFCFVYLMQCGAFIKIGIAAGVEARRKRLQHTNPLPVKVAAKYGIGDRRYAFMVEKASHRELADRRGHGEWFAVDFEDAREIVRDFMESARKLMKARNAKLKAEYEGLWDRYRIDREFRAVVDAHEAGRMETVRKSILRQQLSTKTYAEFEAAYRSGEYDNGRVT